MAANVPLVAAIRAVQDLHPLQAGDKGHFLCVIVTDKSTHSCHGPLTTLDDLHERVFKPAAFQLQQAVKE